MGALHAGHEALIREAGARCDRVVVSIFVNPAQFGPGEDFASYPRPFERDLATAEGAGAGAVFAPEAPEIYARDTTRVRVSEVSERWEGAIRPGHFEGVATVVLKLFQIVQPHDAFFGWKDLQQCAVIGAMTRDLFLPLRLHFVETVREPDGLALSSRNAYLTPRGRIRAGRFNQILVETAGQIATVQDEAGARRLLDAAGRQLREAGFEVDYCAMVEPEGARELPLPTATARLMAAVRIEGVRLLDNVAIP
jgi:pantoate--beta-alanine ligase